VSLTSRLDRDHLAVYRAMPEDLMEFADIPASRVKVAELRAQMAQPPLPEGIEITDRHAPGRHGGPDVMVRIYRPAGLAAPSAALFWIHGGGMILGDVDMDDHWCAAVSAEVGIIVASVDYRLAPEHPYPTPLEDCYTGLQWVHAEAGELGVDPGRIAIGGASAGGGLAAGLALLARDRSEVPVVFQLLVYPMLDDRNAATHSPASSDPKVWNRHANRVGWESYLAGQAGSDDVPTYAAPARATQLKGLPPTYLSVGDLDLFLDEDLAYAQALMRAGVPVELHVYPGAFHGSNTFVSRAELSKRWARDEREALARALADRK
jgi:acetyl esterase/lipase